jgi:hypothetical protein
MTKTTRSTTSLEWQLLRFPAAQEYKRLQAASSAAYQDMMLFGKCLAIVIARTRRGLIHQANYLAAQFNDLEGCENGCMYMPERINGRPWPEVFLRRLACRLRRMGPELEPAKRSTRAKAGPAEAIPQMGGDEWRKAVGLFCNLEKKGMVQEAVKCLQTLLMMKPSITVAIVKNRPPNGQPVVSQEALSAKIDMLDEGNRRYIHGYMQGLIDGRAI